MSDIEFEKELKAEPTNIPGMLVFDLSVHGDSRGWFKENWQRAKQAALGLPDLGPVQNNISFNAERGGTSTSASLRAACLVRGSIFAQGRASARSTRA